MHLIVYIQKIKAMLNVSKIHYMDFNALNAVYVKDGVCGFLCNTVYRVMLTFLDLSTTWVIAGKTHSQSQILKTKNWSNFKLTMQFKHEMIGVLPNIQRNFKLSGTLN